MKPPSLCLALSLLATGCIDWSDVFGVRQDLASADAAFDAPPPPDAAAQPDLIGNDSPIDDAAHEDRPDQLADDMAENLDLAAFDLFQEDSAQPDLAEPDLTTPDLTALDYSQPDLATPDLLPVLPHCSGVAPTCGDGTDSCCRTLPVTGGMFSRGNNPSYPATVSNFWLDKYEVTVARFRRFVAAGMGTQASPPAPGAGLHPRIAGSDWDAAWTTALPATTADLLDDLRCSALYNLPTWTSTPGSTEALPVNCVSWFVAFAFCAWDEGRLPTESEWNYTAAGGSEQRVYPWSVPASSTTIDATYASYGCLADGVTGCLLADIFPVGGRPKGEGRWGHSDLAGNELEWTLDWHADLYPIPCIDCANVDSPSANPGLRVLRGGGFSDSASPGLTTSLRARSSPTTRMDKIGFRCARDSG